MGAGSSLSNVLLFLSALERVLSVSGHRTGTANAAMAAAESACAQGASAG
jgi:hypothetical protein